ncbi:MAG: aminotransferase class I/II-fold pyridoxal phosphate-dependent enzyme [Planctomycetes bacterium]|nr:aminotransferase class I/II-fold pyridoxal phosphate-dependent enzyme [Planctomycetota bacterium]
MSESSESTRTPDVHINLNIRGMKPSATVAINERSNALLAEGRNIYKLGLGQSPFPVPDVVVEELKANAYQKDYLPVKGLRALRDAVADYHRRGEGCAATGDDVLIGPGSKELMFILQLVYYGDLVIPAPAWVSYAPQAKIIGRNVNFLPTDAAHDWMLTAEQLDAHCNEDPGRPRIVILNYPSNPTGRTYTAEQLQAIAAVAKKHKLVILSDEIYGELHHEGNHLSISRYYPKGTIISSGLSKWCGAGGWRLGTFTFPRELRWLLDAMASVASETYTSTSAPIQYAAVRAFKGGPEIERYLWRARKVLKALGNWMAARLNAAAIRTLAPQGGFYLFPDFSPFAELLGERGITSSWQLCDKLLGETGVAILPGSEFGRPKSELTARLAYVDFDGARAMTVLESRGEDHPLDEAFLNTHCPNVVAATEAICGWVQG